jgi:hypothetical protein
MHIVMAIEGALNPRNDAWWIVRRDGSEKELCSSYRQGEEYEIMTGTCAEQETHIQFKRQWRSEMQHEKELQAQMERSTAYRAAHVRPAAAPGPNQGALGRGSTEEGVGARRRADHGGVAQRGLAVAAARERTITCQQTEQCRRDFRA